MDFVVLGDGDGLEIFGIVGVLVRVVRGYKIFGRVS